MKNMTLDKSAEKETFEKNLLENNMKPLWANFKNIVTVEPETKYIPNLWSFAKCYPILIHSTKQISIKDAERRVLILENPGSNGDFSANHAIYSGLQIVLPGEIAPAHRHSQSALRIVLQADDAITKVDGIEINMRRGDVILTPAWTVHSHENRGSIPAIWIDILDIPTVNFLGCSFLENGDINNQLYSAKYSLDKLHFKYQNWREKIFLMYNSIDNNVKNDIQLCYGIHTGEFPSLPSLSSSLNLISGKNKLPWQRTTESLLYVILEGNGVSYVGNEKFNWQAGDILVIPPWYPFKHELNGNAVMILISNKPILEKLFLLRTQ